MNLFNTTLKETTTTVVTVLALTGVATLGTGCGLSSDNAVKIVGHVGDAAGLSKEQKAEVARVAKLTKETFVGTSAAPAPKIASEDANLNARKKSEKFGTGAKSSTEKGASDSTSTASTLTESTSETAAPTSTDSTSAENRTGEWIDRIAAVVALFSGEGSKDRAEN